MDKTMNLTTCKNKFYACVFIPQVCGTLTTTVAELQEFMKEQAQLEKVGKLFC